MQDGRSAVNGVADLVKEECVAVALNGHMLNWLAQTDGENGEFIKANRHPSGGNCFVLTTPGGDKLAGGNGGGGAQSALNEGLAKWRLLEPTQQASLPDGKPQTPPEVIRCTPPPDGLILASYVRNLKRDEQGKLAAISGDDLKDRTLFPDWNPIYTEPAHFSVWLTAGERRSLVPASTKPGQRLPLPEPIAKRLIRYHLVNGTFGLPGRWPLEDIRHEELTLVVEDATPLVRMRLEGTVLLASNANLERAERGYDARLLGLLECDPKTGAFSRFDVVAIGDYWGGDYEGGRFERPGRTPLGIAFELVPGQSAVDRVPPLVHMDRLEEFERYFAAERADR